MNRSLSAFIERLAALVPRPRAHQQTYHGVLAPAAAYRDLIVPGPRDPSALTTAIPNRTFAGVKPMSASLTNLVAGAVGCFV